MGRVSVELHSIHGQVAGMRVTADIQNAVGHFDNHPIFTFKVITIFAIMAANSHIIFFVRMHMYKFVQKMIILTD